MFVCLRNIQTIFKVGLCVCYCLFVCNFISGLWPLNSKTEISDLRKMTKLFCWSIVAHTMQIYKTSCIHSFKHSIAISNILSFRFPTDTLSVSFIQLNPSALTMSLQIMWLHLIHSFLRKIVHKQMRKILCLESKNILWIVGFNGKQYRAKTIPTEKENQQQQQQIWLNRQICK